MLRSTFDASNTPLRKLTVESNARIHTVIRSAVEGQGLDPSWIASIESSIADLGECMASGQWVVGLRSLRKAQNDARALEEKAARERVRKERERLSEPKVGKAKSNDRTESKENEAGTLRTTEERQNLALKAMHTLSLSPSVSIPSTFPKHLLITLSFNATEQDKHSDFDSVSSSNQCVFLPDVYSFPFFEDEQGKHGEGGTIVCGLDTWNLDENIKPRIIGGGFVFRDLASVPEQESLSSILRLSIYTYLSLILEQDLLSNSHVNLQYLPPPTPIPAVTLLPTPIPLTLPPPPSPLKRKTRAIKVSSDIWSFISKRTESIFHRGTPKVEDTEDSHTPNSLSDPNAVPSPSKPSGGGDDVTAPDSTAGVNAEPHEDDDRRLGPFASAMRRVGDPQCVLSTSPDVVFPPPPLLSRLATREQNRLASTSESSSLASSVVSGSDSTSSTLSTATIVPVTTPLSGLRLTAAEKVGLGSILGWEGREARGKGMVGIRGFVRHQGLTVLYAEHVPPDIPCGRLRLKTFRYWARSHAQDTEPDQMLGDVVERACEMTEEPCWTEGCDKPRGLHSTSWTCCGMRISAAFKEDEEGVGEEGDIMMWESCAVCGQKTTRVRMDDGTYLFSFAKYLELLLWSSKLASLSLCEHTKASELPPSETRFRILRHFTCRRRLLTFNLTRIEDQLFEIRVPKLQALSGSVSKEEKHLEEARRKRDGEEEREKLFAEMDEWWKTFIKRLDRLDAFLQQEITAALIGKDLPPLPMSDDQDINEGPSSSWLSEHIHTPSPQRPQANRLSSVASEIHSRAGTPLPKASKPTTAPYPPGLPMSSRESRQLLVQLRLSFQKTEDITRKQATEDPQLSLNDVRRAFHSAARGALRRLAAWQKKHAPGAPAEAGKELEPEWWQGTCHAVPGGRVVVRESEWGSVIAFTLTSRDYQWELASLNSITPSQSPLPSATAILPDSPAKNFTIITKTVESGRIPDPDDSEATSLWEESEPWTAVISRREHPREISSLLSLRDVLRNKKSLESSSLSRISGATSRGVAPPSAWTQPQVQVNLQSAGGQVSQFPEAAEAVERMLGSQHPVIHQAETTWNSDDTATPTPSSFVEKNIRSGKSASIISFVEVEGDERPENPMTLELLSQADLHGISTPPSMKHNNGSELSSATTTSSFGSALSNAVRYFLSGSSPTPSRPSSPTPASAPHHGLLALEAPIDDRPHIKYDWTIGKRLKFSCTVYYAKQFDALRKRCGVDDTMPKSLERTANWTAVGGKSKANFWKSADDRFIIKTLVDAWNVADLQVLIDLGPSYFRYIDSTASKPSVLAKLMGFYTVEIKNLETGTVQAKADLLITENLFYHQNVSQIYDMKGIQSRRVKVNGDTEHRTLFDGDWIDRLQRSPLLIQPHSKLILQEAIKSDADFLAKSNIMDYSLLLGVDEDRHEIACGIVDTIGSYTFAKTLEYRAKQNLNSNKGKEVTVLPPAEYQTRFVNAVEGYFFACPDKWTKPPLYIDRMTPCELPSVL